MGLNEPPFSNPFMNLHLVLNVKHDLHRKSRMVAGGHMMRATHEDAFSSAVSLKGMILCIFIAELNVLNIMVGDLGNVYLETYTREKIYFIAGPEFGEIEGVIMIAVKALYDLKTSGTWYMEYFED